MRPAVSVVIGAYDAANRIAATLQSVLDQTFPDFEVVVVDDGSRDQTPHVLRRYAGRPNVHVLRTQENLGLTRALIRGVAESRGRYIARIDAGDRMHPERLARQVEYLERHPEVAVVGSYCRVLVTRRGEVAEDYVLRLPLSGEVLVRQLPWRTPVVHASCMYRRAIYDEVGGYDPGLTTTQDYDLWVRVARLGGLHNLPEALTTLTYETTDSITHRRNRTQILNGIRIRLRAIRAGTLPPFPTLLLLSKHLLMLMLPKRLNDLLRLARRKFADRRASR